MKGKTKEFLKKYLIGFILGFVSVGIVAVYAETYFPSNDVTYDNTESGLSSTNVQGAIDELYGVCTAEPPVGETIIENAGLTKDEYECRYFFIGANPNNYVTFNGEDAGWRIISVECDGTIKIMRINSIGNQVWNSLATDDWSKSDLSIYLNEIYYNGLNAIAQGQTVSHDFAAGEVSNSKNNDSLSTTINKEKMTKWNGKVALITVSEYIRSNSNNSSCGTHSLYNNNYSSCKNTTWMYYSSENWWTMSPFANDPNYAYDVDQRGRITTSNYLSQGKYAVRPALYLSSSVTLTGSGTQSDPYVIS